MDKEIKKLECPFTWNIEKTLSDGYDENEELSANFDEEPLYAFITLMAEVYLDAVNNRAKVVEKLKKLDDYWEKLDVDLLKNIGVSENVLLHIKAATKYYIHKLKDSETEANEIYSNLEDAEKFNSLSELATIHGCKSVLLSRFHEKAHRQVTETARLAISGSPNCPLWHYILAKGLKHARRDDFGIDKPLAEEESSIIRSCQLSDSLLYKIHLAQMFREQKKIDEAKITYLEIYEANPKGQEILLRLARAFTSFREFEKAEVCFEKAEGYSNNTMYHHYKGIFYIKTKKYKMAATHFQEAAKRDNYRAGLLYAWTLSKINYNFDFIAHLKGMLKKFSKTPKFEQQTLLHITMHYYYLKNDWKNTLKYLLKAIEFDPRSRQLLDYTNTTINWDRLNIYDFTKKRLQEYQNQAELTKEIQGTVEKLRDYCQEFFKSNDP